MGRLPQTHTTVSRYLRQQKRVVTRLANSTPYALSGTSVVAPGLTKVDERIVAGTPGGSRVELDSAGLRKYAADGTTVQVDLTGEVAAFSGLITGSEIIGGEIKTANSGARIEIVPVEDGGILQFYSGDVNETYPALMQAFAAGSRGSVVLQSAGMIDGSESFLTLTTGAESVTEIYADRIETNITTLEKAFAYGVGRSYLKRCIFVVADATGRAALVADYAVAPLSRVIDSANPLFIWKADESAGAQLQYTVNGTTFVTIGGGSGGSPASETVAGIVELATSAEAVTGTDTARAVTPAGVKAVTNALATIGAWTAYTPTLSAATGTWSLGTTGAINDCVWRREGDLIRVRWKFVLGTGFTFPTLDPRFTLPVAAKALAHGFMIYNGVGSIRDPVNTGGLVMVFVMSASASTTVAQIGTGVNPVGAPALSPTSPWTWVALNVLQGEFTYRPA